MKIHWTKTLTLTIAVHIFAALFATIADAQGPIANGETLIGTISTAGQTDSWTFAATAGDAIIVRVGEVNTSSPFSPRIQLLSPTSVSMGIASGASAAEIAVTATNTGTFTVRISDNAGTQTNSYRLTLATTGASVTVSPGDTGGPLTNGVMHTGTIDTGDLDVWTVTATNGNAIVVRMGEITDTSANFTPWVRLYSPTGVLLDSGFSVFAGEVAVTATNAGTFLVVVGDGNISRSGTGTYRLTLAKTGDPVVVSPSDEGGPMTNGVMHTGTIDTGDLDVWTVSATNGDAIIVRMGEITDTSANFTPWVRVYSPSGVLVGQDFRSIVAEVAIRATNSGPFLVVVGDGNGALSGSGIYRLTLAKTGDAVLVGPGDTGGPLTNGLTNIGTIETGALDLWTVSATNGDAIIVRMGETNDISGNFAPWVRVYSPSGVLVGQDFSSIVAEVAIRATNTGPFLVVVGDGNGALSGSGIYRLTLAKTGDPVLVGPGDTGGPLTNGLTTIGTIDTGDLDVWTVSATNGDAIIFRMGETNDFTGNFTPWVRVYSPSGVQIDSGFGAAAGEVAMTATNTGTFLVVVGDGNSALSGSGIYRLTLAKTGDAVVVGPGDTGGPLTNGLTNIGTIDTGDLDLWTVSATNGEAVIVRMGETNDFTGNFTPWIRVYSPTGVLMTSPNYFGSFAAEVAFTATNSGPYLVVVGDGNSALSGSGIYRLTLAKIPGAFFVSGGDEGGWLGTGQDGAITVGDLDMWKFCAGTGSNMLIQITELTDTSTNFWPWIRLYGPDGTLLNSAFGATGASITRTATNSGTFVVLVGDGNSVLSGTGTYRLSATGTAPCVSCSLSPLLATNMAGMAHTVTEQVSNNFTNVEDLSVGAPVSFTVVAGPNIGQSGTATTSLSGQGSFTYIGTALGIDSIRAVATVAGFAFTNTVTKYWLTPEFQSWQTHYFGSTNAPLAWLEADPDGDGQNNLAEFLSGFDPTDSAAYLHIISIVRTGNDVRVTYLGGNGDNTWSPGSTARTNVLDLTTGNTGGSYSNSFTSSDQTNVLSGGNGLGIVTNFVEGGGATNIPSRYYRIRVVP